MKKIIFSSALSVAMFISGCGSENEQQQTAKSSSGKEPAKAAYTLAKPDFKKAVKKVTSADKNSVCREATLREKLPENAGVYARIPAPACFFSEKEDILQQGLSSKAFTEQFNTIQKKLGGNLKLSLPPMIGDIADLLISKADAPLELFASGKTMMEIKFFAQTHLNKFSEYELNNLFSQILENAPSRMDMEPQKGEKPLIINMGTAIIQILIKKDGTLLFAFQPNPFDLKEAFNSLKPVKNHPMYTMENEIDTDHKGLFQWIDTEIFDNYIKHSDREFYSIIHTANIKKIAAGLGVQNKKSRLKIMIDAPENGLSHFVYKPANSYSLKTAGEPGTVISLALPNDRQVKDLENLLAEVEGERSLKQYQAMKTMLDMQIGMKIDEIIKSIGTELILFTDEVGSFAAVKIGDKELLEKNIALAIKQSGAKLEVKTIDGVKYNHLSIGMPKDNSTGYRSRSDAIDRVIMGKTHLFWIESDGYLIFSLIPQSLMDRVSHNNMVELGKWLKEKRGHSAENSLIYISSATKNMPRYFYYAYINFMQMFNDIAESDLSSLAMLSGAPATKPAQTNKEKFDIFSIPSAYQLGLPVDGSVSMDVSVKDSIVSIELSSDVSPLEAVTNGATSVAIVGILAAVAVPAYQDYVTKSKLSEPFMIANSFTQHVNEAFLASGMEGIKALSNNISSYKIQIDPDNGKIIVSIDLPDFGYYSSPKIIMTPTINGEPLSDENKEGDISWRCSAENIPNKFLPRHCQ